MGEHSRNWIVIGSSLSATDMLPVARERWPNATTITTNAGIELFGDGDWPTYYLLFDHVAAGRYATVAKTAQQADTILVTADRMWDDLPRCPHTEHYDVRLMLCHNNDQLWFEKGSYNAVAYSGLLATQFALNNGAEAIAWVGMDGFQPNGEKKTDHIDGRPGGTMDAVGTQYIIRPYMQSCLNECPEIPFTFYGCPRFRLGGNNLTMIREAKLVTT